MRSTLILLLASAGLTACASENTTVTADTGDKESADKSGTTDIPHDPAPTNCPIVESREWTGWINAQPPGPATLHIRGDVDLPTPGYSYTWREGIADRALPPGQRMHLDFSPPEGIVTQVITPQTITYAQKATYSAYRVIYIVCGEETIAEITDIQTAH